MTDRVVISGIGVVTPIGNSKETFWRSCVEGRSGVVGLDSAWFKETGMSTRIAALVRDYGAKSAGLDAKQERLLDRTTLFALGAGYEAVLDAGLQLEPTSNGRGQVEIAGFDPTRVATVVGSGMGGITTLEISHAQWRETRRKTGIKRYSLPMLIPNAAAGQVAIRFGARGECKSLSTACAAGTMALGDGCRLLRSGEADLVIAGGTEGAAGDDDGYSMLGFDRLRTLSTRNDEPERASRPFDRERDGFVLGEGAAILILEREADARARGARIYATILGYTSNCDAHSMMQLDGSGRSVVTLIESTLASAGVDRDRVDYVSAHGTSTRLNDKTEAKVLRKVFGDQCDDIPVTALKSMTGHAIAGSGPLETAAAALSLHEGLLVPTINYEHPDPECPIDVVANTPRRQQAEVCVKLSYGFGGHNACLLLGRA